ncbi:hypothetical protein HPB52_022373 [Rhipicephalus sanguineus]|uniref:Uncharacterized protein n=1 Tax=Rhipicephalus sanguineus TaxID=34632 RepID=A0A9D4QAU6_RHISA|nr:hypothetical protein HPB52_022373 [Rhipicephalus sanguineus]
MHVDERVCVRTQQRQLDDEDDDSANVWKLNVILKYENHSAKLNSVCFVDFVASYTHNPQDVRAICGNEVIMAGFEVLVKVDDRLRQVTQNFHEPFGGLDIYMCGDLCHSSSIKASEM